MPDRNYCYITFDQLDLTFGKAANKYSKFSIKRVIFNAPATIVLWADGTKTVVKSGKNDKYDPEKGLAMCFAKKALGNKGKYYDVFKEWLPEEKTEENFGRKPTPLTVEEIIDVIVTNYDDVKRASAVITCDDAIITCFDSNGKVICKAPWNMILDELHYMGIK